MTVVSEWLRGMLHYTVKCVAVFNAKQKTHVSC